ncbi:MAG: mannose-1-phosphate guanylyltransferase/mannose-6-phosphate isomerase [Acidiferrobacterales bacterium]
MAICPVILSGGSGSRLWPLSREFFPKQLLALVSELTLLQETARRTDSFDDALAPIVVCNEEHRFLVAEQLREIGKPAQALILEPEGRNTAPALTLAAMWLKQQQLNPVMLVMPADHVIANQEGLSRAIGEAYQLAKAGRLVTFGVVPTSAHTGYGYIRQGDNNTVAEFVEKPDAATAEQYYKSGDYLWNSGLFMMQAETWLQELEKHNPEMTKAVGRAMASGNSDMDFFRTDEAAFLASPSDSIDYAVMEKTDRASVVPLEAEWSDIGAWSSLWETLQKNELGNVVAGDVFSHDTNQSFLISQHRMIATVGVDNLIVVETPDAVLVCSKDKAQDVKHIVNQLKESQRSEYQLHRRVHRPWGTYETMDMGDRFQVKRLTVKPGASLSLQSHQKRAEHWVVVKGQAKVTRDDEVIVLNENESTYIAIGQRHRLENESDEPLEVIEVQSGSYLGEDDIERFDDIYDRLKDKQ